jgi:UDP-N-acetylglucosamine 2-epimerase (non-hydrolysing)
MKKMDDHGLPYKVLFTGQHNDIAPKDADYVFHMDYVINNNRLDSIMGNILKQTDILDDPNITHVLVQGDTSSVLALAISAFNHKKKIIHLEAGLRTYDLENPYPEEANRQIVSRIADINLCPTLESRDSLFDEKTLGRVNSFVVGNTALDNLVEYKDKCEYGDKILVTLHRRENHHWMDLWFSELNVLAKNYPEYQFILPLHPNPNVQKHKHLLEHVKVVEPLEHSELLDILIQSKLVITDSGGIQEECSFLKKKCLTCRKTTERWEANNITTFLVDHPYDLLVEFKKHIDNYVVYDESPFGDGNSSEKIVQIFKKYIYN